MNSKSLLLGIITLSALLNASSDNALPDFMILGVTKCGTTSLYNYMIQHPHILGANKKEVHFFDVNFDQGIEWYKQQFPQKTNTGILTGEASPGYFWKQNCAQRIHKHCPETKFIVIFR